MNKKVLALVLVAILALILVCSFAGYRKQQSQEAIQPTLPVETLVQVLEVPTETLEPSEAEVIPIIFCELSYEGIVDDIDMTNLAHPADFVMEYLDDVYIDVFSTNVTYEGTLLDPGTYSIDSKPCKWGDFEVQEPIIVLQSGESTEITLGGPFLMLLDMELAEDISEIDDSYTYPGNSEITSLDGQSAMLQAYRCVQEGCDDPGFWTVKVEAIQCFDGECFTGFGILDE